MYLYLVGGVMAWHVRCGAQLCWLKLAFFTNIYFVIVLRSLHLRSISSGLLLYFFRQLLPFRFFSSISIFSAVSSIFSLIRKCSYLRHASWSSRWSHARLPSSNTRTRAGKLPLGQVLVLHLVDVGLTHSWTNNSHLQVHFQQCS